MSGTASRYIGGFDNFSRRGQTPGGFFYDPALSGSPENSALRPNPGLGAYSPGQQDAFTSAVLADMAARNVFTAPGAGGGFGMDYYQGTLGAPLGFYGPQTYGAMDVPTFADSFADRQGAIGGWQAGAQQRLAEYDSMIQQRDAMYAAQVGDGGHLIYPNAGGGVPTGWFQDGGA